MPPDIAQLADQILRQPAKVAVNPVASTAPAIRQWVLHVDKHDKRTLLREVLRDPTMTRVLVFTRTKHGADRVAKHVARIGIEVQAIHGNKSQNARQRALNDFRDGNTRVLVATDIAARGIDVDGITHVINFEIPNVPETYVHRIGRTARAGRDGIALSFCDASEKPLLRDVERLTRKLLTVVQDHAFHGLAPRPAPAQPHAHAAKPHHQRPRQHSRDQHGRDQTPRDQQVPAQQRQRQAPQQHPGHKPGDRPMHRPGGGHGPAESAAPPRHKRPHRHRRRRPQQAQA